MCLSDVLTAHVSFCKIIVFIVSSHMWNSIITHRIFYNQKRLANYNRNIHCSLFPRLFGSGSFEVVPATVGDGNRRVLL